MAEKGLEGGAAGLDRSMRKPGGRIRLTRAERNMVVKRRLFEAAVKVVGEHGYSEASVARITRLAGISQGAFYNHFANRQALLDELLPAVGQDMLEFIRSRTARHGAGATKELMRFGAFFDFLKKVPEFLKILNDARLFAPAGYAKHLENVTQAYARILMRARDRGELGAFTDEEIPVLAHILVGARGYLSSAYSYSEAGQVRDLPEHVVSTYEKMIRFGVFTPEQSTDSDKP